MISARARFRDRAWECSGPVPEGGLSLDSVLAVTVAVTVLAVVAVTVTVAVLAVLAVLFLGDRAQDGQVDGRANLMLGLDGPVEELPEEGAADARNDTHHHGEEERQVLRRP